jgi:predicted DNA-binding protein (MmcQ/YjbR family)
MNIEDLRDYCLKKKGVEEGFPFDETVLVFKVLGKMFALTSTEGEFTINLKCEPEKAIELREKYSGVKPGYHMNKKHWNTIHFDDSFSDTNAKKWIDDSYNLIVKSLTKAEQQHLKNL